MILSRSLDPDGKEWEHQFFDPKGKHWTKGLPLIQKNSFFFVAISGEVIQSKTGKNPLESHLSGELKGVSVKIGKEEETHFFASRSSEERYREGLRKGGIRMIGAFWLEPLLLREGFGSQAHEVLGKWLEQSPFEHLPPGFEFSLSYNKSLYYALEKRIIRLWIPILLAIFLGALSCDRYLVSKLQDRSRNTSISLAQEEKNKLIQDQTIQTRALFKDQDLGVYGRGANIIDKILGCDPEGRLNLLVLEYERIPGSTSIIKLEGKVKDRGVLLETVSRIRELKDILEASLIEYEEDQSSGWGEFELIITA